MKTRIIHTKIWEDPWYRSLTNDGQRLFFYLITNMRINICGMYELSDETMCFDLRWKSTELEKAKKSVSALWLDKNTGEHVTKVLFFYGWVYVKNAKRLGGYTGEKNEAAATKEMSDIPEFIRKCFIEGKCDRVSEKPDRVSGVSAKLDSPINHKSEIINNKSNTIEEKKFENNLEKRFTLSEEEIQEFEKEFSLVDVRFEYAKAKDHLLANGGMRGKGEKNPVKDYKAYLRNWLRKDWVRKKPIVPVYKQAENQNTGISEEGLKKIAEIRQKMNFKVNK